MKDALSYAALSFGGRVIPHVRPGGVRRMGDDSSKAPLTRRVPGATRAGPASTGRPELPDELLQRMQAVVNAAHAQAKQEEETRGKQATAGQTADVPRRAFTAGGPKSSNGVRSKLTDSLRGRLSDEDAEFDTDELPRLMASGAIASPVLAPPNHTAPPNQTQRPGRGDHAATKRDRRAEKRERAAQTERQRAEQAQRERAAREHAERERAREAEIAARAAQVLQERERTAREKAAKEAAVRAERERAEKADRDRAAREQADRERADRDRAARERERAAHERAAQAEREHAAQKAELERERVVQAERERAEQEREQARRERAERESEAPRKRGAPDQANADNTTQLIIAANINGAAVTANTASESDRAVERDGAVGPDQTAEPNGVVKRADHRLTGARADVLEHPRAAARPRRVRRRGRTIALIAAAAVIVAAGPVAVILSRHTAAPPDGSGSELRGTAASWISHQVSPSNVLACDLAMCQTLESYGVSTGDLLVINAGQRDLLNSNVIVSTAAIRQLFGNRLDSVDAPEVLASFGSGKARIEVRVIAQKGPKIYLSQLAADLQLRKNTGQELAQNPDLVATSQIVRNQLVSGQVDARLLVLLDGLITSRKLEILAFADQGPGASTAMPLRSAYLAETGAIANVRSALSFVHAQQNFSPARAESTRFHGHPALYVEFAAPEPLGQLSNP